MTRPDTYPRTEPDQRVDVTMTVNGSEVTMSLPARVTLSDALRDHLGLTGTHVGCEHGICGMCTVLVDGEAARACLLFAVQLDGADVTTVEGLGRQDDLHPLQESFGRHHGLQCGFCTPGFLMSSYDLLSHQPDVQREELPAELSGVLCRCTGYRNIIDAVDDVAQAYRDGLPAPGNCAKRTLVGRTHAGGSGAGATVEESEVVPALVGEHPDAITLPSGDPTISVDVTSELSSSPEEVAAVFGDIRVLARCLPGAELTEELGDGWYAGRARISLGPVRLSFNGLANVLEQSPDRIAILAQGRDTGGGGAQADIVMGAEPSGTGTRITATASVFLTGRIAGFGRSLAGDVSRRMFEDFARAVDQAAQGQEPVESTPPGALTLLASAVGERIRARVATLRDRAARRRTSRRRLPTQKDR